jgi:hypothetical protein
MSATNIRVVAETISVFCSARGGGEHQVLVVAAAQP